MKKYIMQLLITLTLIFGLSISGMADEGKGVYKLNGAWVAKVNGMPGQWSYVISADPSGKSASGHGSVDVGFNPNAICGPLFEPTDSESPILVNMIMTGSDTVSYYAIWYGLKDLDPTGLVSNEIVLIGVVTGELKFVAPGKSHGSHNFALYDPTADADGDGFPDEGSTAQCMFPMTTVDTRMPMPE